MKCLILNFQNYGTEFHGRKLDGILLLLQMLAVDQGELPALPEGIIAISGRLVDVIASNREGFKETDAYVAGPPVMMPGITQTLIDKGVQPANIHIDSFGL